MSAQHPYPGGYSPQPVYYSVPPRFAPLDRRGKRASFWAGAVGLNFMSIGSSVMVASVLIGAAAALFAGLSASADQGSGLRGFDEFLMQVGAPVLFLVAVVVGIILFLVGMFASVAILKGGHVRRPWAVTWSAFAVSLPALWMVNMLTWAIGQVAVTAGMFAIFGTSFDTSTGGDLAGDGSSSGATAVISFVGAILALLVSVGAIAAIGWLAWWWMAHVFRARVPVTDGTLPATNAATSAATSAATNAYVERSPSSRDRAE